MSKKAFIGGIIGLVIILIGVGLLFFVKDDNEEPTKKDNEIIYINLEEDRKLDSEYKLLKSYSEYEELFKNDKVSKDKFKNNDYVLLEMMYDECSEDEVDVKNYSLNEEGLLTVNVEYKASCGVCAPQYMYYLLKVDKGAIVSNVKVNSKAKNNPNCDPNVEYKPIIYLYPEKEMDVEVLVGYPKLLTTTYPKYNNGWNVKAYPNGDLIDKNGRTYYGLYWEGLNYIKENFNDGFVVSSDELIPFFEEKLDILGLTEREANEFIMYWLPILEKNEYNLIRFADIDTINNSMPLSINPKPDTVIRIWMEYKPIDKKINVPEQKLIKQERVGFTVIEWGGTLIK